MSAADSTSVSTPDRPGPFGSALSVSEFAALHRASISPVGSVMGCDLVSVNVDLPAPAIRPPVKPYSKTYGQRFENDVIEVGELDRLVQESRLRALTHLRDEASALGANMVVGIRRAGARVSRGIWSEVAAEYRKHRHSILSYQRVLDFQLIGTAVKAPELPYREPRLTTLTATEVAKLGATGWTPVSILAGCSHQFGGNVRAGVSASEITGATALWAEARSKAFEQLKGEMIALGAQGMLGLDVRDEHAAYENVRTASSSRLRANALLVSVSMVATAVERTADGVAADSPLRILTLR